MSSYDFKYGLDLPPINGGGLGDFKLPSVSGGSLFESGGLSGLNVGSLLGSSGIPFAGAIGGILNGFMTMGHSKPESFAKPAKEWGSVVMQQLPITYKNDIGKMLTEMDYHLSWIHSVFVTWVKTSRGGASGRTGKGHAMGRDYALKNLNEFRKGVESLRGDYNIKITEVPVKVLPTSLSLIPNRYKMRADIVGGSRAYQVTAKPNSGSKQTLGKLKTTVDADGKTVIVPDDGIPPKKGNFNPLHLLWLVPVGIVVWLVSKFKK